MTAISEPESAPDERDPNIGENVRYLEGGGELRIEDETLVAPEFVGSDYGWTRLQHACFSPSSDDTPMHASLVYGKTRRVRLSHAEDRHIVLVDVEFDENRDGQMWQRAIREEYEQFEVAFERYIELIEEGLVDTALMECGAPASRN